MKFIHVKRSQSAVFSKTELCDLSKVAHGLYRLPTESSRTVSTSSTGHSSSIYSSNTQFLARKIAPTDYTRTYCVSDSESTGHKVTKTGDGRTNARRDTKTAMALKAPGQMASWMRNVSTLKTRRSYDHHGHRPCGSAAGVGPDAGRRPVG